MSEHDEQLPDTAPVKLADDQVDAIDGREQDDPDLRAWLEGSTRDDELAARALLRDRELDDGDQVSANTVGSWAVYDNQLLRFVEGGRVHADRGAAQRELDELRPTTGHDLVVVEV